MTRDITSILFDDGIQSGVYHNVATEAHHLRNRMNPSSLAEGLLSHREIDPSAIRFAWENKREFVAATQDRMDRGTLTGILLMQPERLANGVAVWDRGKRASAAWAEFKLLHAGKLIVKRDDFDLVSEACRQFRFNKEVVGLLSNIDVEVELITKEGRVFCSGQVDAVTRGPVKKIIDLKTTDAGITEKSVERTIREMCYREKMSLYRQWLQRESKHEVVACYNLFLKITQPLAMRLVKFTTASMDWGYDRMSDAIQSVDKCLLKDEWPIYCANDICDVAEWELPDVDGV